MVHAGAVLTTLIIYKLALLGIGAWASRRTNSEDDFLLGGRGLGAWTAGLSYAASTSSAWVLLGFSGFVYAQGLVALWMVPGILMGYVVVWLGLGPRLRAESAAEGHVTSTDFIAAGTHGWARRTLIAGASALILFCFVFYIAAQFQAAGAAFETSLGMGRLEAVALGAGVILVYALLGGFWAVSVTDALQAVVMAVIAVALPAATLIAAGGPAGVLAALQASAPEGYLSAFGAFSDGAWLGLALPGGMMFAGFALGVFAIGLGPFGQPHLLARLMAVKDEGARKAGFRIAIVWALVIYAGMTTLALSGRALAPALADGESVFYHAAGSVLAPVLAGVVIAAVLSAVMSTVDSILLSAAGAVSHDLGVAKRWPAHELLAARAVMAVICALAVAMTLTVPAGIFGRVLFAWSALGAAFGPLVIARVAGREPYGWARVVAMLTGFALTVLFNQVWDAGPGAVGERLAPWAPALAIAFGFSRPRARTA